MGDPNPKDIEDAFKHLERLEQQDQKIAQEAEQEEEKLAREEQQEEQAEEQVDEEREEAEGTGNIAEIEDAEKKQQQIIKFLKKESKDTDQIIQNIEKEVQIIMEEEKDIEGLEKTAEKEFMDAIKRLKNLYNTLKTSEKIKNRDQLKKILYQIEETLQEVQQATKIFNGLLQHEGQLVDELRELEKEENNLEKLAERLLEEIKIDEQEVKKLLIDSQKIQSSEDMKAAKMEGKELHEILGHWNEEEAELEQIDQKIKTELKELQKILGEDSKVLKEMKQTEELLEGLEKEMDAHGSRFSFMNPDYVNAVYEEIDNTRKEIDKIIKKDEKFSDNLKQALLDLQGSLPQGPSARKVGRAGASASITTGKLVIGAFIALVVVTYAYIMGPSF